MSRKQKKKDAREQSTRQLMGIDDNSVAALKEDQREALAAFIKTIV